jgi:hypothetical protein
MRLVAILTIVLATLWLVLAAAAPTLMRWEMTSALSRYGSSQAQIEAIVASEQAQLQPRVLFAYGVGGFTLCAGLLILRRLQLGLCLLYACAAVATVGALLLPMSERPPSVGSVVLSLALWLSLARLAYVRQQAHGHTWWRSAV